MQDVSHEGELPITVVGLFHDTVGCLPIEESATDRARAGDVADPNE